MQRYRTYGQRDDVPEIVGDPGFVKLDMLTDPALLPPQVLSVSENLRFDANGTTVRAGIARQFPAGSSIPLIYGTAVFKPSSDEDYLVFATGSLLVIFNLKTQDFAYYNYPGGETISTDDRVDIVQAGVGSGTLPQIFILRGTSKSVLQYDGNSNTIAVATGFAQGDFALFYQDRIAVATSQDVHVSDFLDFTTFALLNQFQILKGGDDYLQCFVPYQKDYVLIGSRQGWFIAFFDPAVGAGGYAANLNPDTSFLRSLTREAGPVGPKAAIEAMGLVWFISGGAIYAFQPQLDNQLVVLGKPLSADIQPIMDRMCVRYAQRACIERYGYRLYFALPISDLPVNVSDVEVEYKLTTGLVLPFTLPAVLSTNAVATLTTDEPHGLASGDRVQISGSADAGLNREFPVLSVTDNLTFTVAANLATTAIFGTRIKAQKLATRNNCIAVYNLNNQGWESIDWMPMGLYADWMRSVEHAATRRLMLVDETAGPMLYEESEADEIGDVIGGVTLPTTLPFTLSASNFATKPIAGQLVTRCYRWGMVPHKVTKAEVRGTFDTDTVATLTLKARNPNYRLWTGSRTFTAAQFSNSDVPLRKLCGERALEAQVQITTSGGRPTFRSVAVETVAVGKVEE